MPVILATQESEIRRIVVRSQAQADSSARFYFKKPLTKLGLVEWLKVKALRLSPSTSRKKKKSIIFSINTVSSFLKGLVPIASNLF
jgi:ribosomal protein S21